MAGQYRLVMIHVNAAQQDGILGNQKGGVGGLQMLHRMILVNRCFAGFWLYNRLKGRRNEKHCHISEWLSSQLSCSSLNTVVIFPEYLLIEPKPCVGQIHLPEVYAMFVGVFSFFFFSRKVRAWDAGVEVEGWVEGERQCQMR